MEQTSEYATRKIPLRFGTLVLVRSEDGRSGSVHASYNIRTSFNFPDHEFQDSSGPGLKEFEPLISFNDTEPFFRCGTALSIPRPEDYFLEWSTCDASDCPTRYGQVSGATLDFSFPTIDVSSLEDMQGEATGKVEDSNNGMIGPTITGTATEEEPHVCEVCGRPFRRKKDIRRHLLTHTTEKPFSCPVCLIRFKSRDYLHRHCRRIHGRAPVTHPESKCAPHVQESPPVMRPSPPAIPPISPGTQPSPREVLKSFRVMQSTPAKVLQSLRHLPPKKRHKASLEEYTPVPRTPDKDKSESPYSPIEGSSLELMQTQSLDYTLNSPTEQPTPERSPSGASDREHFQSPIMKVGSGDRMFLCSVCSELMARVFVMVMPPNPNLSTSAEKRARVVCRRCFCKKTGLICIS